MQTEDTRLFEMMQLLMQRIMQEANYTLNLSTFGKPQDYHPCKCSIKVALAQVMLHIRKGRPLNYLNITFIRDEEQFHVLVNIKKIIKTQ